MESFKSTTEPLNDKSIMSYGGHKGKKLIDIPASYFIYISNNHDLEENLIDYIENNMEVFQKELEER
jgi:hypothetical protein